MTVKAARPTKSPPPAWEAAPARDRLSSTTFIAALCHGIIILGVTFGAGAIPQDPVTTSLEVVLLTAESEPRSAADDAVLLARQNLVGTGNAAQTQALMTVVGMPLPGTEPGPIEQGDTREARTADFNPFVDTTPVLVSENSPESVADTATEDRDDARKQTVMPGEALRMDVLGHLGDVTRIPDANPRELLISANTRESRIASYLNTWKRKVEQTGTLNFPFDVDQANGQHHPVLEVAIRADGSLRDVRIRTSSGRRRLDQAAIDILRMSAPFQPFPASLQKDYDVLRFAYEWHFSAGSGTVRSASALL